jgi:hypothetical protein
MGQVERVGEIRNAYKIIWETLREEIIWESWVLTEE